MRMRKQETRKMCISSVLPTTMRVHRCLPQLTASCTWILHLNSRAGRPSALSPERALNDPHRLLNPSAMRRLPHLRWSTAEEEKAVGVVECWSSGLNFEKREESSRVKLRAPSGFFNQVAPHCTRDSMCWWIHCRCGWAASRWPLPGPK